MSKCSEVLQHKIQGNTDTNGMIQMFALFWINSVFLAKMNPMWNGQFVLAHNTELKLTKNVIMGIETLYGDKQVC